jgi:hypothetical protein
MLENPFKYPDKPPEWIVSKKQQQRRKYREKKLGRPLGEWGGKRAGAGRPRQKTKEFFQLKINNIQRLNLEEMGDGDLTKGIQKLIDMHV